MPDFRGVPRLRPAGAVHGGLHDLRALPFARDPGLTARLAPLLDKLQARAGDKTGDYKPGEVAEPVSFDASSFTQVLRGTLTAEAGRRVVWSANGNELMVQLDSVKVAVTPGVLFVGITVSCDQTGPQDLTVPFATGTPKTDAGLVVATPERQRGHELLAELWGEAVIALLWGALVATVAVIADRVGRDLSGAPLLPASLRTDENVVSVVAQAAFQTPRRKRS